MPSPSLFFETVNAYQKTAAIKAAIDLDLFTALVDSPADPTELASRCNGTVRGVRILADYLTILGFLEKSDDGYQLTPDTAAFLNRRSPQYAGRAIEFLLSPQLTGMHPVMPVLADQFGVMSGDGAVSDLNRIVWKTADGDTIPVQTDE